MFEIIEENTKYYYFNKGEKISPEIAEKTPYFNKEAFDLVSNSDFSRNILIPHWANNGSFLLEHLYWKDNSNLAELDNRVKNGDYGVSDFEKSIKTYFEVIKCPNCKGELKGLSIDYGNIYIGSSEEFTKQKISKFSAEIKNCIHCNSATRRAFLYYFG